MISTFVRILLLFTTIYLFSSCSSVNNSPTLPISNSRLTYFSGEVDRKEVGTEGFIYVETFDVKAEDEKCRTQFLTGITLDLCLNNIIIKGALFSKDTGKCESIADKRMKNICHENVLLQDIVLQKDISRCGDFSTKELAGNCVAKIGISNSGTSLCDSITDKETRNICTERSILDSAITTLDSNICKGISDEKKAAVCRQVIENRKKAKVRTFTGTGIVDGKNISVGQRK